MFLGIDIGTSSVKALVVDEDGASVDSASAPLEVSRPEPKWSEQDPDDWWKAADQAVRTLAERGRTAGVRAVGLSGQMHGATLLGDDERPLRPAILWNDGRSELECRALESKVPRSRQMTGNLAMPGFTAPKILWVRAHEPAIHAKTRRVLLPKDYVRLQMTGEAATDRSDASGTLWLDVERREWSQEMLSACDLDVSNMPRLVEGPEQTGRLKAEVAAAWKMDRVPVAGGAGDQAAGALGAGAVSPGDATLSLGTSGVIFAVDDSHRSNPDRAMHAFCHCLPNTWHRMSVILSAASCLSWVVALTGAESEADLLAEIEAQDRVADGLLFLPYLSGERTPHNDPSATGTFHGLSHSTHRADLGRAVLEGVAFAFADAQDVLREAGGTLEEIAVIGGGARSPLWGQILSSVLGEPLVYRDAAEVGPALGAARLARLCISGEAASDVCTKPPVRLVVEPEAELRSHYARRLEDFRKLYLDLK